MKGWKEGDKQMEGWKDGRMEGRMEGWKDARIEGKTEGWKSGSPSSQPCAPNGPADNFIVEQGGAWFHPSRHGSPPDLARRAPE